MCRHWLRETPGMGARLAGALCVGLLSGQVGASASVDAAASLVVFPVVAQTASYSSEITIRNPNAESVEFAVWYIGGNGTAAPGQRYCGELSVGLPIRQVQFDVQTRCALPAGSHFGMLLVVGDADAPIRPLQGYSRVTNPLGLGFSVPAFPANVFESSRSSVIGLKRQAAAPGYQSNCFVGSLDGTTYQLALYSAAGAQIGSTLSGTLAANQLVRFLDVFSAVGAPAGDHSNVRAEFVGNQVANGPGLIAFCTVQDNTNFGADFRIAGATAPFDNTRTHRSTGAGSFPAGGSKHVYQLGFRAPDWLRCFYSAGVGRFLELRVVGYDAGNLPVVVGGGNNMTDTGRMWLAPRSAYSAVPWRVEASIRDGAIFPGPTFPLAYALTCESGSGHAALGSPAIEVDDF